MLVSDYQVWTLETAVYRENIKSPSSRILYVTLGLAGEAGETAERLNYGNPADVDRGGLKKELGDVCYYVARDCDELGFQFEDLLRVGMDVTADDPRELGCELASRSGRVAEIVKKALRNGSGAESLCGDVRLKLAMADVVKAITRTAERFGFSLGEILAANKEKLLDRKARGVICGSGDTR